jgi:hypothetical protein
MFHVTGDPSTAAMALLDRGCRNPFLSGNATSLKPVGWVFHEACEEKIRAICKDIPTPGPQSGGPARPNSCEEWTKRAFEVLMQAGVVQDLRPSDSDDTIVHGKQEDGGFTPLT